MVRPADRWRVSPPPVPTRLLVPVPPPPCQCHRSYCQHCVAPGVMLFFSVWVETLRSLFFSIFSFSSDRSSHRRPSHTHIFQSTHIFPLNLWVHINFPLALPPPITPYGHLNPGSSSLHARHPSPHAKTTPPHAQLRYFTSPLLIHAPSEVPCAAGTSAPAGTKPRVLSTLGSNTLAYA